ncbi:MAG: hypothetical protein ACEPOW_13840 [Bacteroidales bacterium]
MRTISGREINIKANQSKRTFTIRVKGAKYRTYPMNTDEFTSCENNTANDWQQFLNNTCDYYKVK